ncbi:MAG TPA: selenocysteine-specific translation elongation factor [Deltaproteobacteria bacterium]|nr:selenocysteine-specific translation elongation factor [Deltaproteobacteria bacterium]
MTIGIAGHVDHGKTSLVRTLTGIDTDRMKEEKRRGLSMEFGIAPLNLLPDVQVSLVDVPGHTDFMKNTIRGLSAVDAAVLVIAADDGVMPQTREHLEILRFMGVRTGMVVFSKTDLVDADTLALAEMEVHDLVQGTFLDGCPMIGFSSVDGRGRQDVMQALQTLLTPHIGAPVRPGPFRMFIDQIRVLQGQGTVVSGTVLSGTVRTGDRVEIVPGGRIVRVRSLQAHHAVIDKASQGYRVGINLQGVSTNELFRGMVLAEPGRTGPERFLNVTASVSRYARNPLRHGERVRLFLGTAVTSALVTLMEQEDLAPGENGLAQLRPAEPMGALAGDRYVITPLNSPMIMAGGRVLETSRVKYRKANAGRMVPVLKALTGEDPEALVQAWVSARPETPVSAEALSRLSGMPGDMTGKALAEGVQSGLLAVIDGQTCLAAAFFRQMKDLVTTNVEAMLAKDSARELVLTAHIATALPSGVDAPVLERILEDLVREGRLVAVGGGYTTPARSLVNASVLDRMTHSILSFVEASGMSAVTMKQILVHLGQERETRGIRRSMDFLLSRGDMVRLSNERFLSQKGLDEIKERVRAWICRNGCLTPADCAGVFGYGRTAGVPVIEYLDSVGFTARRGNDHVLGGADGVSAGS